MMDSIVTMTNELLLAALALAVVSVNLITNKKTDGKVEVGLTVVGLFALLALSFTGLIPLQPAFGGVYKVGPAAAIFKRLFLLAGVFMALLSWPGPRRKDLLPFDKMGEYLGLMLLSITGMCFLVSARELVLLYVALELVTIPLILLVAINRHELRSVEAGLKYVLFSALSSGLLLYGLSLIYGLTGTTLLTNLAGRLNFNLLSTVAMVMVLAGVGFKISAVPFHLWTPDTYEGAPAPVTAFLSVASKAAGFVLFYQVIAAVFGGLAGQWQWLVASLAALTMTFGNLVAIYQTNVKRFLAFSSISQAGYLMIGLVHQGDLGLASVLYYLCVYLVSNMGAFAVVIIVAAATGKEDMRDYAGLSQSNPFLALVMMLAVFSLAGIPPLAGFLGKFYLFAAAAQQQFYWLVFVGAVNATIALYYYLMIVKWMYISQPATGQEPMGSIPISWAGRWVLVSSSVAMILMGIFQVLRWIEQAATLGL